MPGRLKELEWLALNKQKGASIVEDVIRGVTG